MEIVLLISTLVAVIAVVILVFMLLRRNPNQERLTELETNNKILESNFKNLESSYNSLESKYKELESSYNLSQRENSSLKTDLRNKEENLIKEIEKMENTTQELIYQFMALFISGLLAVLGAYAKNFIQTKKGIGYIIGD